MTTEPVMRSHVTLLWVATLAGLTILLGYWAFDFVRQSHGIDAVDRRVLLFRVLWPIIVVLGAVVSTTFGYRTRVVASSTDDR